MDRASPLPWGRHLSGRDELFGFALATTAAYYTELHDARAAAWHRTASQRLDELHDGLAAGLVRLTAEQREAWDLIPVRDELVPVGMSEQGATLPVKFFDPGNHRPEVLPAGAARDVRITFHVSTDVAEPQNGVLAFRRVPTLARVREVEAEIASRIGGALA